MFLTKLKSVSMVFLVVATLSGAAGAIYRTQAAEQPKAQTVTKQADANKSPAANLPAAKTDMDRRAATEKSDPLSAAEIRLLQGIWDLQSIEVDAGGRLQKGTVAALLEIDAAQALELLGVQHIGQGLQGGSRQLG